MTLKTFDNTNVATTKQFNAALKDVFAGISGRNNQLQQLMVVAVNEAGRESGGQVTNNLSWLTSILSMAQETNGINVTKVSRYIVEVLCCDSVVWKDKTSSLGKGKDKELEYNLAPDITWMEYGKKETVKAALDYSKGVTNAIAKALDAEKGGLTMAEVLKAVMAGGVTAGELTMALEVMVGDELEGEELKVAA